MRKRVENVEFFAHRDVSQVQVGGHKRIENRKQLPKSGEPQMASTTVPDIDGLRASVTRQAGRVRELKASGAAQASHA
jgi:hypothetical protein